MTAENDADREAFEALRRRLSGLVLDLRCDEENDAADDVQKAIDALAHARQPGEPVAWIVEWQHVGGPDVKYPGGGSEVIRNNRAAVDAKLALLRSLDFVDWAKDTPLYTHPAPPAPVAVPEGDDGLIEAMAVAAYEWRARILADEGDVPTPWDSISGTNRRRWLATAQIMLKVVRSAAPSPASPEKGMERMREALEQCEKAVRKERARPLAHPAPGERRRTPSPDFKAGRYEELKSAERIIRAALASLPAEPEGETFPYQKTFDAIAAATSICGGHVSISVQAFREAFGATHPPAPKPAEHEREVERMRKALNLALKWLEPREPGDSRAVSNEFVAMAAVACDCANEDCIRIIDEALAELSERR